MECDSDPHCVCFAHYLGAETLIVVLTTLLELMTWSVILTPTVCVSANCMTRKMCFAHYTGANDLECDSDPHCVCFSFCL